MSFRPRHVLMTADAVGGVWTYAHDLAEGLRARNIDVTLAVAGPPLSVSQRRDAHRVQGLEVVEIGGTLDWLADGPDPLDAAAAALRALVARTGADLVHLNTPAFYRETGWGASVVGVCHSCVATWWDAVRGDDLPRDFKWRTERLADGYRRCDRLIAPSGSFARATAARYGVKPVVVHNGRRRPQPARAGDRRRLVLTSGRLWDEGKNIAVLERAAQRMRGSVEAAGALQGPNGQAVRLTHVAAHGRLDAGQMQERLWSSAIFCSPALYEPFGLGVLEAAQAGCALVLSDIPTFRELWNGAALFVSPYDDAALARLLDELIDDADRTARLGRLAQERARRFTIDRTVLGTLSVYRDVLARRSPSSEAAA